MIRKVNLRNAFHVQSFKYSFFSAKKMIGKELQTTFTGGFFTITFGGKIVLMANLAFLLHLLYVDVSSR